MKEYNEQVVETLDDAGCIIANKNIIIDNLQARIAELEEENARLRTVPMKYRRMQFNAQLQDENRELLAQLATAQEEINEWRGKHDVACLTITKLQKQYEIQLAATSKAMGAEESLLIVKYQLAKAEQRVAEWQPIETAPKCSSTVILGFDPSWYDIATPMFWSEKKSNWRFYQIDEEIRPTHWMPLPKAPNDESS